MLADFHDVRGVDIVLDRKLTRGNDSLGLVADIEKDLVSIDLDDGALNNVTVVELLDGLVDRGEEGFLGPDVVDRYLRGARGGLGAGRHVWNCSERGQDVDVADARQALFRIKPMNDDVDVTEREPALSEARASPQRSDQHMRPSAWGQSSRHIRHA
jgi:hypothetical protein